ncbi:MAG: hypothetical protein ACPGYV_12395, partial [Phycisphaeraceae bacterium]
MYVGGSLSRADRRFEDWHAEGLERWGIFPLRWFWCPRCGLAHTPGQAEAVGVVDDRLGCVCPEALGGCGFPWFGCKSVGAYYERFKKLRIDKSGMVSIAKDGGRIAFHVLPYCPAERVPADGVAQIVGGVDPRFESVGFEEGQDDLQNSKGVDGG